MLDFLNAVIPNVMDKPDELWLSTCQTLYMLAVSGVIAFVLGVFLGTVLTVTAPGAIMDNKKVFSALGGTINVFRSIPFVILLAALIPFSRFVVGTAIGTTGALPPLVVGIVPFFARQVESALSGVDPGLVEAAKSMGSSNIGIIFRVYLKESIPAIIRVTQITAISLIGLTAMAGAIGGGGLGDFAIRYGHQRGQTDVTYVTVLVILLMVGVIQYAGNYFIRKLSH
ncbi:MAG: methionine ABC transporter permease [Succinivibrio sp.]|jgi:D-methionine transport system permease protein|nr:methionine ABC transporter permease [Succinivibrio sp.]